MRSMFSRSILLLINFVIWIAFIRILTRANLSRNIMSMYHRDEKKSVCHRVPTFDLPDDDFDRLRVVSLWCMCGPHCGVEKKWEKMRTRNHYGCQNLKNKCKVILKYESLKFSTKMIFDTCALKYAITKYL